MIQVRFLVSFAKFFFSRLSTMYSASSSASFLCFSKRHACRSGHPSEWSGLRRVQLTQRSMVSRVFEDCVHRFRLDRGELTKMALTAPTVIGTLDPDDHREAHSSRVDQPCRSRKLLSRRAKNYSIAALSPQTPTRPRPRPRANVARPDYSPPVRSVRRNVFTRPKRSTVMIFADVFPTSAR